MNVLGKFTNTVASCSVKGVQYYFFKPKNDESYILDNSKDLMAIFTPTRKKDGIPVIMKVSKKPRDLVQEARMYSELVDSHEECRVAKFIAYDETSNGYLGILVTEYTNMKDLSEFQDMEVSQLHNMSPFLQ